MKSLQQASAIVLFLTLAGFGALLFAKDRPEPPRACVFSPSKESSVCVSGLRWIMYGETYSLQRISGAFENNTPAPIRAVQLTFSLFDANDNIVGSAVAATNATVPPGGKALFNAPVEEPMGSGIRRITLYTNLVRSVFDAGISSSHS